VVAVGYCGGFLVKEGFAWVGGIAAVGRQRVKIGDKGPLDCRERRGYHTLGETARRPTERDRTPLPACERVPRCGADPRGETWWRVGRVGYLLLGVCRALGRRIDSPLEVLSDRTKNRPLKAERAALWAGYW
jgi:hypothetical protein